MEETKQENFVSTMYDNDQPLQKEIVSPFVDKTKYIDQTKTITVFDLGKGQFRDFLRIQMDGEEQNLNISKINKNTLIDLLGNNLKEWENKTLNVKFVPFKKEGLSDGVTLEFSNLS